MTESKTVATGSSNASSDNGRAIRSVANAIVESVREAGDFGAPSGIVYAALNAHGMNLDTYHQFIGVLVKLGKLRQQGDLLFAVEIGGAQ